MKPKLKWHRRNKLHHYEELTALFSISSATGEFARSSNTQQISIASTQATTSSQTASSRSSTPLSIQRVRTRGVPLREDAALPEPVRKRVKIIGSGPEEAYNLLISALRAQQSGSSRALFNPVELAIQLLQKEYETRLSEGHFLEAVDFLTAEAKASVFISLNSGIRDMWLSKNASVILI